MIQEEQEDVSWAKVKGAFSFIMQCPMCNMDDEEGPSVFFVIA